MGVMALLLANSTTWNTDPTDWIMLELPAHIVSCFFVPLAVALVISKVFDEPFLLDANTRKVAIREHAWQSMCGLSVWFWCNLFLHTNRVEPTMSVLECIRNLVVHYFLSDVLFYVCHRFCHTDSTWWIHKQHHSHKATKGALIKLNALSGTCVHFWDMVVIGHLPIFLPCFVVTLPFSWMICYVVFSNLWISMIHSVGSRIDKAPSCGGFFVTPKAHAQHHMLGCKNVNYSVYTTIWDRILGTYAEEVKEADE